MSTPAKHHYVPQTYLRHWEDSKGLLWVYDMATRTYSHRTKRNILHGYHLYTITLDEWELLTDEQKQFFIEPLSGFHVIYHDVELGKEEIIKNLSHYDEFVIKKEDGSRIRAAHKEDILQRILNSKYTGNESRYSRLEAKWNDTVTFFEKRSGETVKNKMRVKTGILKYYADSLLDFILSMYTRNPYNIMRSIVEYESSTGEHISDTDSRMIFETIQTEYLDGTGQLLNMKKYDIQLIYAPETGNKFFTTDCPVVVNSSGIRPLFFIGRIWFPITPKILVILSHKIRSASRNDIDIHTYTASNAMMNRYNRIICGNAENIIISSLEIKDPRFRLEKN